MFEKKVCVRLDERIVFPVHTGPRLFYLMLSAQTGSLTQLAFCSNGTGSKSSLDVNLATDIHLVPRRGIYGAVPPLPICVHGVMFN